MKEQILFLILIFVFAKFIMLTIVFVYFFLKIIETQLNIFNLYTYQS